MATPNEKLAESLTKLHVLQQSGKQVIRSADLTRTHLVRLTKNRYLKPILKGWYMPTRSDEQDGDTTTWFASMRDFIRGYCDARFGEDWYVNPELSLLLHTGGTSLPRQIQVHASEGYNNNLSLPANTSLFDYSAKDFVASTSRAIVQGLRVLSLEAALLRASPNLWQTDPLTLRLSLEQLRDVAQLSRLLLDGGHSVIAGRLAGGLRVVGRESMADEIAGNMRAAGYVVVETNPFTGPVAPVRLRPESPYCGRIRAMWEDMRQQVLDVWTVPLQPLSSADVYLAEAEERYIADAYHSLSIEGYQVTAELIDKVRQGQWSPDGNEQERRDRNTLAARGYYEAHLKVRESLESVLAGGNAGDILRQHLPGWYRALWSPSVQAGILKPSDLAGWRSGQVFIRDSMHVPLPPEGVRDAMPLLFDLLQAEPEPSVQAVLGHFVFVFIHPYMDGNGRLARFVLNLMLAQGGWPWTVVTMMVSSEYMTALEHASVEGDIRPFASLVNRLVGQQLINSAEQVRNS